MLLIGDSVSRGYTRRAQSFGWQDECSSCPANCGPTASGIKNIDVWLGDGRWDLIHFNFGIHDRNTPATDYTTRLHQLVTRMQKTGAKLIWATTTPIPNTPDGKQDSRFHHRETRWPLRSWLITASRSTICLRP